MGVATRTKQDRAATGTREPLSRERIVREALALVDADGLEALTMRRLGERLGVEAMSLYGHVDGKQGLVEGMVDLLWGEVERGVEGDAGDWRATLASLARSLRGVGGAHPSAFTLISGASPFTKPMLRTLAAGLEAMRTAGFDDERAAKTLNAVVGYASGYAAMEAGCREIADEACRDELEATVELVQALPRDLPPELVRVLRDCYVCSLDEQFEFGLDALLAGLDR